MPHRDLVRTPWGRYFVDPWEVEQARRRGVRWAEETIARIRRSLDQLEARRRRRGRRQRSRL